MLILASSSPYRREMLSRLTLDFDVITPDIDETPLAGETPLAIARRLSLEKARWVASRAPGAIVIGADQVLDCHGKALGKPGTLNAACEQLARLSGQTVTFHSAVAVVTPVDTRVRVSSCEATFRRLTESQISRYVALEQPVDTAGSAKAEGLGIALLTSLKSDDPTAIIGLPLIALTQLLSLAGLDPLNAFRQTA